MKTRDIDSDAGDRPLRFTYDPAGRAIRVEELVSTGYRVLKEFFFARANFPGNSEKRRGQLVMARRTNWVAALSPLLVEGGVPLVVTDHYQYSGLGGRVSKKTTSLSLPSGSQSFTSAYTYGPLGDIASVAYPAGDWPHQSAPSRQVEYERRLGFLTEVPGYASSITYQLGGMLEEIQYPSGARWRQTAEAATGWERPDKIETFSGSTLLWSTGDYGYDGAGNISEIGDRDYVYDAFSRFSYVRNNGGELLRAFEGKNRATIAWKEDYVYRDGQPLAWIKAAEGGGEIHQYLHSDHLGSTRLVTSAAGAQVSRHDFLPFGEESTPVTGNDAALKFTGHERDQPGKPHDYMHARFSSPLAGRFLSPDPAVFWELQIGTGEDRQQFQRYLAGPQVWNGG